jgi:uncharacterized protein with von Willebrand factor type A (vWA) domain
MTATSPIDAPFDAPFDGLEALPRVVWLPTLVSASGTQARRLQDVPRWLEALLDGRLPPIDADFGDAPAVAPMRRVIGELALPAMARGAPQAAQQVVRTALWHLDRLIDRPVSRSREHAVAEMVETFRAEWTVQRADWDEVSALLLGLGDLASLRWDELQGLLRSGEWARAQQLSALIARAPELVALLRRLGRGMPRDRGSDPTLAAEQPHTTGRVPIVHRMTLLPDAPGEMHGVRHGNKLARMVSAEAAQLRHPVLHKLWRARLAEGRLRVWDESSPLWEAVPDPRGAMQAPLRQTPAPRERGPMILCVDTSGSMKGAPEPIAKAIVLEAARTAHREQRGCHVIAFGGAGEVVTWTPKLDGDGLRSLLAFVGQSFDGGTDIATPIEHAIALVDTQGWHEADLLIVSDGEFGATPATLEQLDRVRARHGLRVQGVLLGDRETMGLLEVCDAIHWVRDWRRFDPDARTPDTFSPVHSKSLTALYFPNALSPRAARPKPR